MKSERPQCAESSCFFFASESFTFFIGLYVYRGTKGTLVGCSPPNRVSNNGANFKMRLGSD